MALTIIGKYPIKPRNNVRARKRIFPNFKYNNVRKIPYDKKANNLTISNFQSKDMVNKEMRTFTNANSMLINALFFIR